MANQLQKTHFSISNLDVSYDAKVIFKNFNITLEANKLYVILGPSGCGKSTLLSAISGLVAPDSGSIVFNDQVIFDKSTHTNVAVEDRNVGFVFQSYALWPHMTVFDNIAFPLKIRKMPKKAIYSRVETLLKMTDMKGYAQRFPSELSGGENQRIALARSLAYHPSLLLLDEPLANLDTHLKTGLAKEIKKIQRSTGVTTLYVTHDQNEAFEIADEIIIMKDGKLIEKGTPFELYNNCSHSFTASFIGRKNLISFGDFKRYFKATAPECQKKCCSNLTDYSMISIPPEALHLVTDTGQTCGKTYVGQLIELNYKGAFAEYIISFESLELLLHSPDYIKLNPGDNIAFKIDRFNVINTHKIGCSR